MTIEEIKQKIEEDDYIALVVYPDGDIEEAIPNHIDNLMNISGKSMDEINEMIRINGNTTAWLVDYTGCALLWLEYCYLPNNVSEPQIRSILKLVTNDVFGEKYVGYQLREMMVQARDTSVDNGGDYEEIFQPKYEWANNKKGNLEDDD